MGNDPSKARSKQSPNDSADNSIDNSAAASRRDSFSSIGSGAVSLDSSLPSLPTLDGHTPFHSAHIDINSVDESRLGLVDESEEWQPPPPTQSRSTRTKHASSTTTAETAESPRGHSRMSSTSSIGSSASSGAGSSASVATSASSAAAAAGEVITLHTRKDRGVDGDEDPDALAFAMHPDLEALLALAQFYPLDSSISSRPVPPSIIDSHRSKNLTPHIMRPKAWMDLFLSLSQRWSGVGTATFRAQIQIGREMDWIEKKIKDCKPIVDARTNEIRQLNAQLQYLPDLHAALQQQQLALQKCLTTMQQLNAHLPPAMQLEDIETLLEKPESELVEEEEQEEELAEEESAQDATEDVDGNVDVGGEKGCLSTSNGKCNGTHTSQSPHTIRDVADSSEATQSTV